MRASDTVCGKRNGFGLSALLRVGFMLLAVFVGLSLMPVAPARASCSVEDAFDAVKQAVETTAICQPLCAESKYKCYGAAGLAIVLTEVSRRAHQDGQPGQQKVDSFCATVQGLIGNVTDNAEAVQEIMALLEQLGLTSAQTETFASTLATLGDALAIVNCACETEKLELKNEGSIGACLNDVLEEIGCGKIDFTTATIGKCDPIGGFVGGIVNDALNEIVALGCELELWACGPHVPEANYVICDWGKQSDRNGTCYPCEAIPHARIDKKGECGCKSLYTPKGFSLLIGQSTSSYSILESCTCQPPLKVDIAGNCLCEFGKVFSNGTCTACPSDRKYVPYRVDAKGNEFLPSCADQCPIGWQQDENDPTRCVSTFATCNAANGEVPDPNKSGRSCKTCGPDERVAIGGPIFGSYCDACPPNTNPSADRLSCVPGCEPGQILGGLMIGKDPGNDPNAFNCQACPANSFASYSGAGYGKGECLPCPDGTTSAAGATACRPLDCGPGSYQDPDDPHACKSCPATQIYIPTEKKIVSGPDGKKSAQIIPGHCGCGENQVLKGGVCACATGATKINLPQAGSGLFACACPAGSQFDAKAGACLCAGGASLENGKCVSGPQNVVPKKRCREGEVLNSKGVCVKRTERPKALCPAGSRLENGTCVPRKEKITPAKRCREGEVRNSKGVCVKRPVTPERKAKPKSTAPEDLEVVPPPRLKPLTCPPGFVPGPLGKRCIRVVPKDLTAPTLRSAPVICPRGKVPDETGKRCVPER